MLGAAVIIILIIAVFICLFLKHRKIKLQGSFRQFIAVPVKPEDRLLERRVRAIYWDEMMSGDIDTKEILLILDEPCSNVFTARRLETELSCVRTVHISALKDYIIRKYFT